MLDDYKSIPFLAGVSLLLLTTVSIGAFAYSSLRSDYAEQSTDKPGETSTKDSLTGGSATESKSKASSYPELEPSGGGDITNKTTGIPTGTYSNPPTTIETGSDVMPKTPDPSLNDDDLESSVERNKAIQQTLNQDNSLPDYSRPSSSNNYHNSQENSLIKPLEENSLLEAPQSDRNDSMTPLEDPFGEPSFSRSLEN